MVHRSTLLVDPNELREVIERFAPDKPWGQRLLSGPSMATESAREMIKLFVPLVDSGIPNYLTLMTSPLAAVYALAVSIVREQKSLLVRSDFEVCHLYLDERATLLTFPLVDESRDANQPPALPKAWHGEQLRRYIA